jgi:hypothetical protein
MVGRASYLLHRRRTLRRALSASMIGSVGFVLLPPAPADAAALLTPKPRDGTLHALHACSALEDEAICTVPDLASSVSRAPRPRKSEPGERRPIDVPTGSSRSRHPLSLLGQA